ncbi:hypothetical protein [Tanticharoenia sakaeratensis]|uniref:Uncharacterized protein n=1 Tax=Tanticharoenia sakaeratensis NBRC 103193 TaxID=1231623 RepID=A0A0D6MNK0_9PROT|nr:hypothetical protein [Tanticharoenia sakaeratensis]GAN55257.1 hypothetical protein Tasa_041_052 [Tanticharoenia sakaeratensis NBRC 103193]GBQ23373.1 hypothetical protein AA103193_2394 [Tanticharoenia sakaeratensis NBRC 103193]
MSNIPDSITLDDGRKLTLRELDPGDQLDLIEAAGSAMNSEAAGAWMGYAQMIASVTAIDDVPEQMPITKEEIKKLARKLGNAGVLAVQRTLYPEKQKEPGVADGSLSEEAATAKN